MRLLAVSDLHVDHDENRALTEQLRPSDPEDWLIVAGDIAHSLDEVRAVLGVLRDRFATVIWVPGNHELWTRPGDPVELRGVARYDAFVALCRELGVLTPEDPWPAWDGPGGAATVAPLFLLYDYSFRVDGAATPAESLARAEQAGIVCADEYLLHADPHPGRAAWCRARVADAERRLAACDPDVPLVLVNHWPLTRTPTEVLRFSEFAQWCGTELTADWHRRFNVAAVVYGHLHIPRSTVEDGVRFEEVSLGYPREWTRRARSPRLPRQILPVEAS